MLGYCSYEHIVNPNYDFGVVMILICPSCETRYVLADASFGESGRNVRCAACSHSWFARPPETLDPNAPVQDESGLSRAQVERLRQKAISNAASGAGPHAEFRERDRKRRQRNRLLAALGAWVAGAIVFAGAAAAAVAYREKVVEIWPKTASFYAMAGMEVNRFGLEFTGLESQRSFDGTTPILTITGSAMNVSDSHRAVPDVRIDLLSETGEVVQQDSVSPMTDVLAPGEEASFSLHIVSPPMESFRLNAAFIARSLEDNASHGEDEHHGEPEHGSEHGDSHAPDHDDSHGADDHASDHGAEPASDHGDDHGDGHDDAHH